MNPAEQLVFYWYLLWLFIIYNVLPLWGGGQWLRTG